MLRVIGCVTQEHDIWLVLLAGLIGAMSSNTAIALFGRACDRQGRERLAWVLGASVAGGCGIWATHFVAMLGFQPGLPFGFRWPETILSVIVAVALTGVGYWLAIVRSYALGGVVAGLAISAMHFVGMAAVRIQARPHWDPGYIVAAVLIAIVFSIAALKLAKENRRRFDRPIAAILFCLGICGLHFTAMASITFSIDPTIKLAGILAGPNYVALAVAAVTLLITGIGLVCYVLDLHLENRAAAEAVRMSAYIQELEATQDQLRGTAVNLEQSLAEAARASQTKSQFLATMSHELRTPLNAVIGFSELLSEETFGPLTPVYKDYAMTIRDSGRHLLGIINDVLDVSKLDADKLELREDSVSLELVIDGCLRIMDQHARNGKVLLTADLEEDLPSLWADEQRVRQVIINLLSNAVKFTMPGGQVRIAAFCREGALTIRVADNGIGMRPEDIPKALERFGQIDSTLSRRTEGTGLGLPLSKRLVELHQGTFVLDSALGVGTSITMTFPSTRVVMPEPPVADSLSTEPYAPDPHPIGTSAPVDPIEFAAA